MSEVNSRSDIGSTVPGPALWPSMECLTNEIKRAAAQDLRECRLSREQVADDLSRLMGRAITVAQIDAFTAESKTHRFPADLVAAWVHVTGSVRILAMLCTQAGYFLADDAEREAAEYGRAVIERERLEMRISGLKSRLWGNQ